MISVEEAQDLILATLRPLISEVYPLSAAVLGQVLAEDVRAEMDSPPFPKSMVDGYALRTMDVPAAGARLRVQEEIVAGQVPKLQISAGWASRVMTGAPVPEGADAVVMHEKTELSGDWLEIKERLVPGQNLLPRGREMKEGELVLPAGRRLRAAELGLLASVGRTQARLVRRPRVAILSTGDELVEPGQPIREGQIRNSNTSLLAGLVAASGSEPLLLGIANDSEATLRQKVKSGLEADALLISGGVSAGKLDLVPSVLHSEGVQACFHKVALKPGKPIWFGTCNEKCVFGLPGNPVSCLAGFDLFVRPAFRVLSGLSPRRPQLRKARLVSPFLHSSDRPTYAPAKVWWENSELVVSKVSWHGSSDLRGACDANGWLVLPKGTLDLASGAWLNVLVPELDLD